MAKVGIGLTSYKRPEHLELCLRQISKHTRGAYCIFAEGLVSSSEIKESVWAVSGATYSLFVAKDIPNIAKAKNECLYNLRDCDHIFLFDEDCFPIKDGWVEFFVNNASVIAGAGHVLYLSDRHIRNNHGHDNGIYSYKDCGGCFMYLTKHIIGKVGYFNTEYMQYGFEHAGYSNRIHKAGYTPLGSYCCLTNTSEYLYSLDYQGEGSWGVKHHQSIADYKAMQESTDYNRKVFEKEITGTKIYYEYER